jgi:hypothetical protein
MENTQARLNGSSRKRANNGTTQIIENAQARHNGNGAEASGQRDRTRLPAVRDNAATERHRTGANKQMQSAQTQHSNRFRRK